MTIIEDSTASRSRECTDIPNELNAKLIDAKLIDAKIDTTNR